MALTDSLVAYWSLEESSGTRVDATGRGNDLSPTNAPGNTTGKIGSALSVAGASTQYLSRADTADLSIGDVDCTITAWVNATSFASNPAVWGKWSAANSEYVLIYISSRFNFYVRNTANTALTNVTANNFGAASTGTWYFVVCWHDAAANTINIQVNNGTADSLSWSQGIRDSNQSFEIGSYNAHTVGAENWNGAIDEVGIWKRVLTADEKTALYNAGAGLAYADFVSGQPTTLRHGATGRRPFGPRIGAGGW